MKTSLILAVISMVVAASAIAGELKLTPGSTATIQVGEPVTVSCAGTSETLPACTISSLSNGLMCVLQAGQRISDYHNSLQGALIDLKDLKTAGACP